MKITDTYGDMVCVEELELELLFQYVCYRYQDKRNVSYHVFYPQNQQIN